MSLESALRGCAIWGAHRSWLWLPRSAFRDGQISFEGFLRLGLLVNIHAGQQDMGLGSRVLDANAMQIMC